MIRFRSASIPIIHPSSRWPHPGAHLDRMKPVAGRRSQTAAQPVGEQRYLFSDAPAPTPCQARDPIPWEVRVLPRRARSADARVEQESALDTVSSSADNLTGVQVARVPSRAVSPRARSARTSSHWRPTNSHAIRVRSGQCTVRWSVPSCIRTGTRAFPSRTRSSMMTPSRMCTTRRAAASSRGDTTTWVLHRDSSGKKADVSAPSRHRARRWARRRASIAGPFAPHGRCHALLLPARELGRPVRAR